MPGTLRGWLLGLTGVIGAVVGVAAPILIKSSSARRQVLIPSLFIDSATSTPCDAIVAPSHDSGAKRRRAAAMGAAFLVHAAAIALLLVKLPAAAPRTETRSIPVEIVREAAPKPKAQAEALPQPQPQPEPQSQPDRPRKSGGDADLAPGKAADAEPTKALPVAKPRPARPVPKYLAPTLALPLPAEPSAVSIPFNPPPAPEKEQAMIPAPPVQQPPANLPDTSPTLGKGGGDPYLNAVRDAILSHFVYPSELSSMRLTGTARYQIVLDRQGNLLGLQLLQSAGNGVLDEAGMETIKRAAPFGPPPSDVSGDHIGLLFIFHMAPRSSAQ